MVNEGQGTGIMSMQNEVSPGYKRTELGILPRDWELSSIGNYLQFQVGFPFKSQYFNSNSIGIRLIKNRDLKSDDAVTHYEGLYNFTYVVQNGEVLIGMDGDFMLCKWSKGPALLNQRIGRIITDKNRLDIGFAYYILQKPLKILEDETGATTVKHLSHRDVENIVVPIMHVAEQRAIATALGDTDALLAALDALIAKKEAIKRATMEDLLSGARRLAGFAGEWELTRIDEIGDIVSGGTPSSNIDDFWDGDIHWCTPTDITKSSSKYLLKTERKITELGLNSSSANLLPAGSLLFCSRATIGEVAIAGVDICTNQGFKSIVAKPGYENEFVYYLLQYHKSEFFKKAFGSTFLEINKRQMSEIELKAPSFSEQVAISSILSDMDIEISALRDRHFKIAALKAGMMDQLLTGRTRLV